MPNLRQLKAEIERLKKKERHAALILHKEKKMFLMRKKKQLETLRLEKELRNLKSPKLTAFRQGLARGGRLIFKAILLAGEDIDKRAKELIKNRQMRIEKEKQLMDEIKKKKK